MFWKRFFGKSRTTASEGAITQFGDGQLYRPDMSHRALVARIHTWVYAMVDRNSKSIAQGCLRLYTKKPTQQSKSRFPTRAIPDARKKYLASKRNLLKFTTCGVDFEEVTEHPMIDLLNEVNGILNHFDLFYLTGQSLDSTGNGYWLKCRDNLGTVTELWPLMPQYVTVRASKKNFIAWYEYGKGHQKIKIPPEEMVHFRYASIKQPFLGSGPLEAAVVSADLYTSMNTYESALFRNGGNPDTLISYPKDVVVNADEMKRIRRDYKRFQSPTNAGKLAIATGGAEIKPFSFSPKEMAFLKGKEWTLKEIAGIYGVPMSFFQDEGVSKANAAVAENGYMKHTIQPKMIGIEETINQDLAPEFDDNLFVAYDDPVPEDKEFRLKQQEVHINSKYSSINEERAVDGLEPVAWGDAPPEPMDIQPDADNDTDKALSKVLSKVKLPPLQAPSANFIPTEFVSALEKYFERQGEDISRQAAEAEFKAQKQDAGDLTSAWFDMSIWDERLKTVLLPFVRATFISAGQRAIAIVDPNLSFNAPAVEAIVDKRIGSIRDINRTTQKLVREAVGEGIAAGEGAEPIQRRIRSIFSPEDVGRKRALLIARTETIWAHNEGAVEAYKQSGVINEVEWLTAEDERVCQWCDPMDGRTQTLGTDFFQMGDTFIGRDGGKLSFGFEAIEHPPLHPQCRCSLAPVV